MQSRIAKGTTSNDKRPNSKFRGLGFVQANLGRGYAATKECLCSSVNLGASILLLQEPYVGNKGYLSSQYQVVQKTGTTSDKPVKAAIVVMDPNVRVSVDRELISENIVCIAVDCGTLRFGVVNVYLEGTSPIDDYLRQLENFIPRMGVEHILLAGDVNAHSQWWGSHADDARGVSLNEFLACLDFNVLNTGTKPTFSTIRGGTLCTSFVDITACTSSVLDRVGNWMVDEELVTLSDHKAITFEMQSGKKAGAQLPKSATRKYNTRKAKWDKFDALLREEAEEQGITEGTSVLEKIETDLEDTVARLEMAIEKSCAGSIPSINWNKSRKTCPWWNEDLAQKKLGVTRQRRKIRHSNPARRQSVIDRYLELKKEYKESIQLAITTSWKDLCTKQKKESMWQVIYRIVKRCAATRQDSMIRGPQGKALSAMESAEYLAASFYPSDNHEEDTEEQRETRSRVDAMIRETAVAAAKREVEAFTEDEVRHALETISPNKAPGGDGFTADICQRAFRCLPRTFTAIYNGCLRKGYFPSRWKSATTVVIPKPGRDDYMVPKAYRPIGLLPVLGKTLEKLFTRRIAWELHCDRKMSGYQYGFTPQRGTEDALYDAIHLIRDLIRAGKIVVVASLDIEGAFDSAWWPAIIEQLSNKQISPHLLLLVRSYLSHRRIDLRYAGCSSTRSNSKGCIQGSTCGPLLWNVLLDPVFSLNTNPDVHVQAFADDILVIAAGRCTKTVEESMNTALEQILHWGGRNKLKFAAHKTQVMVMTRRLKYDQPNIKMGGTNLELVNAIKLLGVTIDRSLTFNSHLDSVIKKAAGLYKMVASTARAQWGLNSDIIRIIYLAVVEPTILYAASIWADAANKETVRKKLDRIARQFAIKISKAHKTCSYNSCLLLARIIPLDLRAREQKDLYEVKRGRPIEEWPDARVEDRVHPHDHPHPAQRPELTFRCITSQEDLLEVEGLPSAYTDGSKIEGKVGMAVSLHENGRERCYSTHRLADYCSVFQAELMAILRATEMVSRKPEACILSDSRSALECICAPDPENPVAAEIRHNLCIAISSGRNIKLYWIKAHVGFPGNERADYLAKNAAIKDKRAPVYDRFPVSFGKRILRERTIEIWQARYLKDGGGGSVTRLYFRNVRTAYSLLARFPKDNLSSLVFTGHGGTRQYLHRFKLLDTPYCVCGLREPETVIHLLIDCPRFASDRFDLEQRIGKPLTNLGEVIEDREINLAFLDYARSVMRTAARANGSMVD